MEFPGSCLAGFLLFVYTLMGHGQVNAQTQIPDTLITCYKDQSLRNPENRPPMTIATFIDIVRKVESYQKNTEDIRTLATSMLHRFRLDGIERSKDVKESDGVIPFAVKGNPFYKNRLILRYLVPANDYQFPNESLTQVEMCTLHFMLSHSIEKTQRGDESTVCGRLSNYESNRDTRIPRNARFRRQIEEEDAATKKAEEEEVAASKEEEEEATTEQSAEKEEPKSSEQVPDTAVEEATQVVADMAAQSTVEQKTVAVPEQNLNQNLNAVNETEKPPETSQGVDKSDNTQKKEGEVEVINQTTIDNQTKSGKFIFDDNAVIPPQKARSVVLPESVNTPKFLPLSSVESDCPVENGAVRTNWGTVSLGAVLAGIVAGLYPQEVLLSNLVPGTANSKTLSPELISATIDNIFAATLTGDLAEVTLEQGPKRLENLKVGIKGGWNSTLFPRWYFDKETVDHELTDAEIRGGLDGLLLGTHVKQWEQSLSGQSLRLSQLLSMYYSEDGVLSDTKYRACQRKDFYSEVAPHDVMVEQTYRFAKVLDIQSLSSASLADARINTFAETAVKKLDTYLVSEMMDNTCSISRDASILPISLYTNLTVVIDRNWDYKQIKNILSYLMTKLELGEYGSRTTVLDGKNRVPFVTDVMYAIDFERNFTDLDYKTHEGGMDIPRALEQELQKSMQDLLREEKEKKIAGGRSTVILFIPKDIVNLNNNDLTIAKEKLQNFRTYLPDVKFLYLAPGNKENYRELVDNPSTDIFTFSYQGTESEIPLIIDPLIDRLKDVPLRLINPTCGADWQGEDYNTAEFIHSVKQLGVKYHQLQPNYLFGVGSAQVTVVVSNSDDLEVCYSRKSEYPKNGEPGVTCQTIKGGNVEIKLNNPCDGFEFISQCQPLYISVKSNGINQQPSCNFDCVLPHNVQYTIRNQGLGCRAGIGRILSNPQLISFAATLILLLRSLSFGS